MMKLKATISHLLFIFADLLFVLRANLLVAQKSTIKINIDPQIGVDSQKGPPGIAAFELVYLKAADRTIANDWTSHMKVKTEHLSISKN